MAKPAKNENALSIPLPKTIRTNNPDKVETYGGKETVRVTKTYNQDDGSVIKATRKINKDNTISDKIEHRHK